MMKKTMVLGASPNPARYAHKAVSRLVAQGHEVIPVGIKAGEIAGINILNELRPVEDIHTISLYLGVPHQAAYYDYILSLQPQRLIFNPGTENPELGRLAREQGIAVESACTLVMLATGAY
ncbi:MAG: CoA-binding protein [Bacteroidota bacterium]